MDTSGMLSQEEIDALLSNSSDLAAPMTLKEDILTKIQKDAIGEIGNISMGSAATALSLLLNKKVEITTPQVWIITVSELRKEYPIPYVMVEVKYTQGLKGDNLLMIGLREAAIIADLMMGGSGENPSDELNELHLSAVSEAMNQMMGSAATSLSSMFNKKIDISPPQVSKINLSHEEEHLANFLEHDPIVKVSFSIKIGDLIDSRIMQLFPIGFVQGMVDNLLGNISGVPQEEPIIPVELERTEVTEPPLVPPPEYQGAVSQTTMQPSKPVQVQPVQFAQLKPASPVLEAANIGLLMDIPLQVTVELGRTKMAIKDILELGAGSIIELDKLAGEPVGLLVNGKLIAKGEVVVIDENFGLRITDIISPAERMNRL